MPGQLLNCSVFSSRSAVALVCERSTSATKCHLLLENRIRVMKHAADFRSSTLHPRGLLSVHAAPIVTRRCCSCPPLPLHMRTLISGSELWRPCCLSVSDRIRRLAPAHETRHEPFAVAQCSAQACCLCGHRFSFARHGRGLFLRSRTHWFAFGADEIARASTRVEYLA
jgi:hypothetical protein